MAKFLRRIAQIAGPVLSGIAGLTDILPGPISKGIGVVAGTLISLFAPSPGQKR